MIKLDRYDLRESKFNHEEHPITFIYGVVRLFGIIHWLPPPALILSFSLPSSIAVGF